MPHPLKLSQRVCRVLRLSLLLTLPTFIINLLIQGHKEFLFTRKLQKINKRKKG